MADAEKNAAVFPAFVESLPNKVSDMNQADWGRKEIRLEIGRAHV